MIWSKGLGWRVAGIGAVMAGSLAMAQTQAKEMSWALKYDPRTLDPALVDDQASETVRFLTSGVLLRLNRQTMQVEPALAERWEMSPDGRLLTIHLRKNLHFSDGSPLRIEDVLWSVRRVLNPATKAPVLEEFTGVAATVDSADPLTARVHLAKRVVGLTRIFDEIAIEPANSADHGRVTSGPFTLAEWKHGESLRLVRNNYYWKHDATDHPLPYLASVKLDIISNPEQNELRFVRGQYQLLESVSADDFAALARKMPAAVKDMGPSLNTEQMWFNQAASAPIPAWEKSWFQSRAFRMAVSRAINRSDLARIAYDGHATPADGFISPSNRFWHDAKLQAMTQDVRAAQDALAQEGFRKQGGVLMDRDGHAVKFSILTNAGNHSREKMASLIQQDLAALGMQVNVVTLDFPALIERLMHSQNYEAALLGLSNVEPDPSTMDNVWLSSSPNHQWNPAEKAPATPWEAEIDRQIQLQSAAASDAARKQAFDRVQEIVAEEQPFIYLVYPNALYAVSLDLAGVVLTPLQPGVVSQIESIHWKGAGQ
jgi:peptide/nickel transport system substrate-binding protein